MPRPRNDQFTKDLFFFWRHDPGKGPLSENTWKLKFDAHISQLNESSNPNWAENFDMGRADPKMFYTSTSRTVNINFFLIAMNEDEQKENKRILGNLGLCTYPIYKSGNGYNGPHIQFQIGNHLAGYGIITNLDHNWSPDHPWIKQQPIYTEVNLSIKILADIDGNRPNADKSKWFI